MNTDRIECDGCAARAKFRIHKDEYELFFCGHHARKNMDELKAQNWTIDLYVDESQVDDFFKDIAGQLKV